MKHIKLFEGFQDTPMETPESLLLGYYGEGGIGSHPAILTQSELLRHGFTQSIPRHLIALGDRRGKIWTHKVDEFKIFIQTGTSSSLPGALVCAFNDDYLWDIRGISGDLGQEIIDMIGGDTITSFDYGEGEMVNQIEKMTGLPQTADSTIITIIPNPSPDTVYWSDEPEHSHSYWMPPYRAMSLDELTN